jgi:hypothetical protein
LFKESINLQILDIVLTLFILCTIIQLKWHYSFTGNDGLCGIPGLSSCGPHLSVGAKIGIAFGLLFGLLIVLVIITCWWKRRQNILRAQKLAAGEDEINMTAITLYSDLPFWKLSNIFYLCTLPEISTEINMIM